MEDDLKRTLAAIKPLAKLLPRESVDRVKASQWIKKLVSDESSRRARSHYAGLLLTALRSGHLDYPFSSSPPTGPLSLPSHHGGHNDSLGDELETILQSITDSDATLPQISNTRTWSSLPLSSSARASTNCSGPLHSTPHCAVLPPTHQSNNLKQQYKPHRHKSSRDGRKHRSSISASSSNKPSTAERTASSSVKSTQWAPVTSCEPDSHKSKQICGRRDLLTFSLSSSDVDVSISPRSSSTGSVGSEVSDVTQLLKHILPPAATHDAHDVTDTLLSTRISPVQSTIITDPFSLTLTEETMTSASSLTHTQIHRERMRAQLSHAHSLKKILDRKNNEIEDLKAQHRIQLQQEETKRRRLEGQLTKQVTDSSDKKTSVQQHQQLLQTRFEKKLHAAVSEFERQKLEMNQTHSRQVREMLEQANSRVEQLQRHYEAQTTSHVQAHAELENEVKSLSQQLAAVKTSREQLVKEKLQLERRVDTVETQLVIITKRAKALEAERKTIATNRDQQLDELQHKLATTTDDLKHQMSVKDLQHSEEVEQLQQEVKRLEQSLQETITAHKLEMMESESCSWRQLREKEAENEQKMSDLQGKMEVNMKSCQERMLRAEAALIERQKQLKELRSLHEEEMSKSRAIMEDYRSTFELKTNKLFTEMKAEVGRLEHDVAECRTAKKKIIDEAELERKGLTHKLREKERELQALTASLEYEKARASACKKTAEDLEQTVCALSQQLEYQQAQRKRESEEIRNAANADKESALLIHKSAISKLRTQLETQRTRIREEHNNKLTSLMQRHQEQVEQLELDKVRQTALFDETTVSLQSQIHSLHNDFERQQQLHGEEMRQLEEQHEQQVTKLKLELKTCVQTIEEQYKSVEMKASQLLSQLQNAHMEKETMLSQLKIHYESRLQGMLPASARKDYEDIIQCLQSQVLVLSQRGDSLQREVEHLKTCSKLKKHKKTPTTPSAEGHTRNNNS